MKIVRCSLCTHTEENPPYQGMQPDTPHGWAVVTIAERGRQIVNRTLCPRCTAATRTPIPAGQWITEQETES